MSRYENTKLVKKNKIVSKATTIYSSIPEDDTDLYIITQYGDRLDNLAYEYYGDQHLWWFIARANHLRSMNVPAGTRLRIPIDTEFAKGF